MCRERVRKKSKMEVESLRSRFRIMQTTATLERSPSVSESELSFEVIASSRLGVRTLIRGNSVILDLDIKEHPDCEYPKYLFLLKI
jgi:hypothetical protein